MTNLYDANYVAWYFDELGEREWTRLVNSPADEIKLYIHSHYLEKHIEPGSLVLDVGAGPGRFTQLLVSLGATVVVADISAQQIELNKRFAAELNFAHGVKEWRQLDICDMSAFPNEMFDAVVCYGNPLGYVFEKRNEAFTERLSQKPRNVFQDRNNLCVSVSLWLSLRKFSLTTETQRHRGCKRER